MAMQCASILHNRLEALRQGGKVIASHDLSSVILNQRQTDTEQNLGPLVE